MQEDYNEYAFDETTVDITDPAFYRYNITNTGKGMHITRGEQFSIDATLSILRDALEMGVTILVEAPQ